MNPHYLFLSIALTSIVLIVVTFVSQENTGEIYEMAKVLGVASVFIGVVLLLTRKYWMGARRL